MQDIRSRGLLYVSYGTCKYMSDLYRNSAHYPQAGWFFIAGCLANLFNGPPKLLGCWSSRG